MVILRAAVKIMPHGINFPFQKWSRCALQWGISVLDSVMKSPFFLYSQIMVLKKIWKYNIFSSKIYTLSANFKGRISVCYLGAE